MSGAKCNMCGATISYKRGTDRPECSPGCTMNHGVTPPLYPQLYAWELCFGVLEGTDKDHAVTKFTRRIIATDILSATRMGVDIEKKGSSYFLLSVSVVWPVMAGAI